MLVFCCCGVKSLMFPPQPELMLLLQLLLLYVMLLVFHFQLKGLFSPVVSSCVHPTQSSSPSLVLKPDIDGWRPRVVSFLQFLFLCCHRTLMPLCSFRPVPDVEVGMSGMFSRSNHKDTQSHISVSARRRVM